MRSTPSEPPSVRFEGPRTDASSDAQYRPPTPSGEFEEGDEEGARAGTAGARAGKDKKKKGAAAATKRKSGAADDDRRRGGAASWQRWEDWDED